MKARPPQAPVPSPGKKKAVLYLSIAGVVALIVAIWKFPAPGGGASPNANSTSSAQPPSAQAAEDAAVISKLVTAEETAIALLPKMSALSRGLLKLELPAPEAASVFSPEVRVTDLGPRPEFNSTEGALVAREWPAEKEAKSTTKASLWRPLLDGVARFEHARVRIMSGEHPAGSATRYEATGGFEALALMKSGEWRSLEGKLNLTWERAAAKPGQPVPQWQITEWKTSDFRWIGSPKLLFVESLEKAMRGPQEAAKLRKSLHFEATVKHYKDGMKTPPHPYFAPISVNQKEGIAIADVNGDGFDDIYITVRIGRNMLLLNNRDGTFTEDAARLGLALPGHTTCALFADFDNDGDLDAMLGRSLLRSTYLENRGGVYIQHPIPAFMPMAVISMAAADYNGDGLLDVYLCTYRPAAPAGASPAGGVAQATEGQFDWPDEFFSPEIAREYRRRVAAHDQRFGGTVLDQLGPPNLLLVNRGGGRFEPAQENPTVGVWRNSLQATWGDYNEDGKPDLYIANDWGTDVLFRNDGVAGFTDVTAQAGLTEYGFAMGASWGDYDNDGLEDLYVSNMYSDPGRRMTGLIPGLNPMFAQSATGNWLYHHQPDGSFKQVAGLEAPAMTVMNAGWSWGGHFADFDNDRFQDLYVINGYFSAPRELASDIDLESNLWRTMVRSDENMARPSFRFSPEWKRTPAPDNLGPQIDARLVGVDRQGDKVLVHSINGSERNRFFANRAGRAFADLSGISGLDNVADSRGFALLDYDRDGWQDLALVNANEPLFNLYHNEMPAVGMKGGMIAVRFVGGSKAGAPSQGYACRDGFGARVRVELGDAKLVREHRCGEGWSTQNSATMIIGIGPSTRVPALTVKWPSGKVMTAREIPEGTLLTVYENPADSPNGKVFTGAPYRVRFR